ncbi:phytoene/squalene synthase family protein [Geitlerinema sp. PCC 9228]|jgi:farnesyl-diphosphate farnesyltransferase|uniref:squalene/phytoene synthase family protein n=1 Tax=Geitlerinema sp. PCC 9228 TaxID=111611 RepID=UPI0008F9ACC4|nr:phytoene/squalene synthase family protein [Geitlerinema sp. PCC 9228]
MNPSQEALDILQQTSRTFYIPIVRLPPKLQEAVASAYLCMRAIDEIEDSAKLPNITKANLLREISLTLQSAIDGNHFPEFSFLKPDNSHSLEEVTVRIDEWALLAPESIAPRVWDATAAMSDRMAYWAECNWNVRTEADLNRYTFSVAGAVGLLLSDLWAWYDGTQSDRTHAIGFGRGLQAVNILRNHKEDLARGVDFFPDGWYTRDMHAYARRNLQLADAYTNSLPVGAALDFCQIPLALAKATLDALDEGREKLEKQEVIQIIHKLEAGATPT